MVNLDRITSFICPPVETGVIMTEEAVVTDKSLQIKVMGAIALAVIAMIGVVQLFLETSTIRNASLVLGITILIVIAYLTLEL